MEQLIRHTFKYKQSSLIGAPFESEGSWGQTFPYWLATLTPEVGVVIGTGALKRKLPTGG